jgi:lysozyme
MKIEQLARLRLEMITDEGDRLKPYTDTQGKLTIGRGRNLTDRGISEPELEYLWRNDVDIIEREIVHNLPWFASLHPVRQRALINMAMMGVPRLLTFKSMLAAAQAGNWEEAAFQVLFNRLPNGQITKSKYYLDVGSRAERNAARLRMGEEYDK